MERTLLKIAAVSIVTLSLTLTQLLFAAPVNINTADAATLAQSLDGIGQSKAEAIVAYREQHGAFKSVNELQQVKGIGDKTFETIKADLLLNDAN